MKRVVLAAGLTLACGAAGTAERIGQAIPLSGIPNEVSSRLELGLSIAATEARQRGAHITVTLADSGCSKEAAQLAGETLKQADVQIVIGPLCALAAATIAEIVKPVPVIALDTRNPLLARQRDIGDLALFELGADADAEARAIVEKVLPRFKGAPFALLDDGGIYGRGLSDAIRLTAEEAGLSPAEVATFRPGQDSQKPLLRRLARSGIKAIVVLAPAEDISRLASDLAELDLGWQIAAGEAGRLLPLADGTENVPDGVMAVFPTNPSEAATEALTDRIVGQDARVEDLIVAAHALMSVAVAYDPSRLLETQSFPTLLGNVTFGTDGRATPLAFALYTWRNGAFHEAIQ
jgi:branched-chain amino acid transport system substrate-binding protein